MNDIHTTINGHVGTDPKLFDSGKVPMASMRVGVTSWSQSRDSHTEWLTVKTFGQLAHNVADTIRTGHPILARGRIVTETYDMDGQERTRLVLVADALGVELSRATAIIEKNVSGPSSQSSDSTMA